MSVNTCTRPRSERLLWRIVRYPLTRLVIALLLVVGAAVGSAILLSLGTDAMSLPSGGTMRALLSMVVPVLAVHLTYVAYVRLIEWRRLAELSARHLPLELAVGVLVGAGLFTAVIAALWALGHYRVVGTSPWAVMVPVFAGSVATGYVEEVLARGIIFRIVEEGLGTWVALLLSAMLFGAVHMGNPNATIMAGVSIALTAGVLLAAAYVLTRRLWLAIGIHFAWNFTQGGIFGVAVSGHEAKGLLVSELDGPAWIAGGPFGAEASIFTILFCVPAGLYLLVRAHRLGRFVRPFWNRDRLNRSNEQEAPHSSA